MPFNTKTEDQFTSDQITAFAGALDISPVLPDGNVIKAMFQAASLGGNMFLQSQAYQTYQYARASSAVGADLDSWMAQFNVVRLQPTQASGTATVGLSSVQSQPVLVQPGIMLQAVGGSPQFQVVADPAQAAWSASQSAYVIPANQLNINVTVQAVTPGSASNVQAGTLTQFASASAPLSTATNTEPILNGRDAETDAALRQRFITGFNANNANGTLNAYLFAVSSVQNGLDIALVENTDPSGSDVDAYVLIIVDDGSGSPPTSLLNACFTAAMAVRAAGIEIVVVGPILSDVTVRLNVRVNPNAASPATVLLNVENAILDYVDSLTIGQDLYLLNIAAVAKNADPNVVAVEPSSVLINGEQLDLTAPFRTIYRLTNTNLTVGTY